jgi:hypothetical protein
MKTLGEDTGKGSFANTQGALDDYEAGRLRARLRLTSTFCGRRIRSGHFAFAWQRNSYRAGL